MLEVLVRDTCGDPTGKMVSSRFCHQMMKFCYEAPVVEHLPDGTTQVSVCLFETKDEILDAVGEGLQNAERLEFEKLWADDTCPRMYERQGDCLLIREKVLAT